MAEVKGVKNLKELVVFGAKVFNGISEAKKSDGKIDLKDAYLLMGLFQPAIDAINEIGEVVPEFKDLSVEEAGELTAAIVAELGMVEEKAKIQVEKSLLAIKAIYEAIKSFV